MKQDSAPEYEKSARSHKAEEINPMEWNQQTGQLKHLVRILLLDEISIPESLLTMNNWFAWFPIFDAWPNCVITNTWLPISEH